MKIAIAVISNQGGGAETSMKNLYDVLFLNGVDTELISIKQETLRNRIKKNSFALQKLLVPLDTFLDILQFTITIRKSKPDVVILNCALAELCGALSFYSYKKIFVVEHAEAPWEKNRLIGYLIRNLLIARKAKWVVVRLNLRVWGVGDKIQSTKFITNPIVRQKDPILTDPKSKILRLVYIGRLSEEKNPKFLLHVAEKLHLKVLFIGNGNLRNDLETNSNANRIDSEFVDYTARVWDLVGTGDLIVVPSNTEGDGKVAFEAVVNGVPLIVKNIQAFHQLISSGIKGFTTLPECLELIEKSNFEIMHFYPPRRLQIQVERERNLNSIAAEWKSHIEFGND